MTIKLIIIISTCSSESITILKSTKLESLNTTVVVRDIETIIFYIQSNTCWVDKITRTASLSTNFSYICICFKVEFLYTMIVEISHIEKFILLINDDIKWITKFTIFSSMFTNNSYYLPRAFIDYFNLMPIPVSDKELISVNSNASRMIIFVTICSSKYIIGKTRYYLVIHSWIWDLIEHPRGEGTYSSSWIQHKKCGKN